MTAGAGNGAAAKRALDRAANHNAFSLTYAFVRTKAMALLKGSQSRSSPPRSLLDAGPAAGGALLTHPGANPRFRLMRLREIRCCELASGGTARSSARRDLHCARSGCLPRPGRPDRPRGTEGQCHLPGGMGLSGIRDNPGSFRPRYASSGKA
jgi:hypothetical protein